MVYPLSTIRFLSTLLKYVSSFCQANRWHLLEHETLNIYALTLYFNQLTFHEFYIHWFLSLTNLTSPSWLFMSFILIDFYHGSSSWLVYHFYILWFLSLTNQASTSNSFYIFWFFSLTNQASTSWLVYNFYILWFLS